MRGHARRWVAVLATGVTSLAMLATVGPASAVAPAVPSSVGTGAAGSPEHWVTLISGDRVQVDAEGDVTVVPGEDAKREPVFFARYKRDGDWYVMPTDAVRLVRAGLIDVELFNVTGLVRQGYDDTSSRTVPLLVQYADTTATKRAQALAGVTPRRRLPKLDMTANDVAKDGARGFWTRLRGQAAPGVRSLGGGVRKVWLNRRYQASLERSTAQVSAPQAWQAGYTGRNVTVAVLDSGYDPGHPDLAGKVVAEKDFSDTGQMRDVLGHGTHVASIVAGSGAASGGARRGVAPDARLAVGKVLEDDGYGQEDALLAGMEWAAGEARAKVVNMSFGGPGADGTGPLSQAVNRLSADYGTLFVAAAGNVGPVPVQAPAAADAALAVGSVTRQDTLSDFSNHGPRPGDGLVKPEIVAPGENIVAARAAGAFPEIAGSASQVPLSGTSMAAPHVAGAAAILAQRHPDWRGDQIKAALTGAAAPMGGAGVFQVGAGRLDAARAVAQPVRAVPATVATRLPWSERGATKQLTVTYHNSGASGMTLKLELTLTDPEGKAAPTGLVRLDGSVTVPAGGQARTQLTVTGQPDRPGIYGGVLTATGGGVTIRTPVTVKLDVEQHALSLRTVDRNGAPVDAMISVINLDTEETEHLWGDTDLRLPAGRYAIVGTFGEEWAAVQAAHPEMRLSNDTTVTLDGRWTRPVQLGVTDRPEARAGVRSVQVEAISSRDGSRIFGQVVTLPPESVDVYAGTAPGVNGTQFRFVDTASLERPTLQLTATAPEHLGTTGFWYTTNGQPPFTGRVELAAVAVPADIAATAPPTTVAGKLVVLTAPEQEEETPALAPTVQALATAGAGMVAAGADLPYDGEPLALPSMRLWGSTTERFVGLAATGALTASVQGNPVSPYRYVLAFTEKGAIAQQGEHQTSTGELAAVPTSYHATGDELRYLISQYTIGGDSFCVCRSVEVYGPLARTEYYTPGVWESRNNRNGEPGLVASGLDLRAGANRPLRWDRAVTGPTLGVKGGNGRLFATRDDNVIAVDLPLLGDADGHWRPVHYTPGVTGSTSLDRNGVRIGTAQQAGSASFLVPAGAADYRLTAEAVRNAPNDPPTTKIGVVWTFRSDTTSAPTALPLLGVTVAAPVDLRNSVRVNDANPVLITPHRQHGLSAPTVTRVTVEFSHDDGKTWKGVVTGTSDGRNWRAQVPHLQRGFVSLRVKAADGQQNSVVQTVLRAYRVS
ncbi:S8 family serine peptidase [Micromonospora sp. KC213]|uniref:S8 family serine peptidase n=1 Tax=Micromonospora sp. KC213 TaxID=2530378 RepID=UPI00104F7830|nr:S8 family serine peptidase [Micromonospora sp. KC213]TDC43021.1 hypothetical protein E1166_05650 [Micromonospora sp. KC213]